MFNLLVLYPEHLNLNGDLANAGVLARRMNWFGFDSAIEFHHPGDPLPNSQPDFLLLGHGSEAAWQAVRRDLTNNWSQLKSWIDNGMYGLAVNSGQELLHEPAFELFSNTLTSGQRKSNFAVVESDLVLADKKLLGYQNSETNAPLLERYRNFLGTQLHGPLLAKNAWFADWLVSQITGEGHPVPANYSQSWVEAVASFEAGVWALESELAGE